MDIPIKLPAKVKIGGHLYDVVFRPYLWLEENRQGSHNAHIRRIEIDPAFKSNLAANIIHEELHAINNVYLNDRLTEDDVTALAEGIYQVFVDFGIRIIVGGFDGDEDIQGSLQEQEG